MKKRILSVIGLSVVCFFLLLIVSPFSYTIGNVSIPPKVLDGQIGSMQISKDLSYKLGLDLQGGTQLTYKIDMSGIPLSQQSSAFEGVRSTIDRRINFFGVSEPSIQTLKVGNEYRVIVELPGVSNAASATELIGKTAELSFWEMGVDEGATPSADLPIGLTIFLGNNPQKTNLSGSDLKNTQVVFANSGVGGPQVQIDLSSDGGKKFAEITKRNIGKPLAIVLDNQVVEAPIVNTEILNGTAVVSGGFTPESAKALSIQLNSGALPAPLKLIGQKTVGPSLGIDSLKKSVFAGIVGFITIIIFMSYVYKKQGILASVALCIYVLITLSIFKLIPITLTLAGIAGFVLSVGMAVDANILIFERMREEMRAGRSKSQAMHIGFQRAWSSIRDSNVSSLITCAILYYFGSGMVRGFALTLAIGILVSMFSAIIVTKTLLKTFDK